MVVSRRTEAGTDSEGTDEECFEESIVKGVAAVQRVSGLRAVSSAPTVACLCTGWFEVSPVVSRVDGTQNFHSIVSFG